MSPAIVRNDITKIECNAMVNAANETMLGGGLGRRCHSKGGVRCPAGKNLFEDWDKKDKRRLQKPGIKKLSEFKKTIRIKKKIIEK